MIKPFETDVLKIPIDKDVPYDDLPDTHPFRLVMFSFRICSICNREFDCVDAIYANIADKIGLTFCRHDNCRQKAHDLVHVYQQENMIYPIDKEPMISVINALGSDKVNFYRTRIKGIQEAYIVPHHECHVDSSNRLLVHVTFQQNMKYVQLCNILRHTPHSLVSHNDPVISRELKASTVKPD